MVTRTQQRLVTTGLLVVAGGALALGALYQGERLPEGSPIVGAGSAADESATGAGEEADAEAVNPIEGWFPQSGEGSACREPVGVDLVEGFGATLTINGSAIAPTAMNVVLDDEGQPTNDITASRSLGHYTYGPETECPNGDILRATDNVIQACVYRLVEGPDNCAISEFTFDLV